MILAAILNPIRDQELDSEREFASEASTELADSAQGFLDFLIQSMKVGFTFWAQFWSSTLHQLRRWRLQACHDLILMEYFPESDHDLGHSKIWYLLDPHLMMTGEVWRDKEKFLDHLIVLCSAWFWDLRWLRISLDALYLQRLWVLLFLKSR